MSPQHEFSEGNPEQYFMYEVSTLGTSAQEMLCKGEFNEGNVRDLVTQQLAGAYATSVASTIRLMWKYPNDADEIRKEIQKSLRYKSYLKDGLGGLIAYLQERIVEIQGIIDESETVKNEIELRERMYNLTRAQTLLGGQI
jgi:hypothetical protein